LDVQLGNRLIYCLKVCIARIDIFGCFLFVDLAGDDINVVGDDFVRCGMREIIDECWYIKGEE